MQNLVDSCIIFLREREGKELHVDDEQSLFLLKISVSVCDNASVRAAML